MEMVTILTWAAALLAFLAPVFILFGLVGRRQENPLEARVRTLASYTSAEDRPTLEDPFVRRVVWPFMESTSNLVARLLPTAYLARVREMLVLAGEPFPLSRFLVLMAVSALALPGLYLMFTLSAGMVGVSQVMGLIIFFAIGLFVPYLWLSRRVSHRQKEISRTLPNAMDLITTSVAAGLGLDAAFARVAEKLPGALAEELQRVLHDTAMGRMRRDALRDLGERTGVSEIITFVNALIHAETTGASVGDTLRVQADAIRTKQRQRVEQTAQRIPIYMTFPLVLFLLPSLFIIILGPAAITVWDSLVG